MTSRLTRIPLTIEAVGSGQKTEGVIVAVMVADLDVLEAERQRFRGAIALAIGRIEDHHPGAALTGLKWALEPDRAAGATDESERDV